MLPRFPPTGGDWEREIWQFDGESREVAGPFVLASGVKTFLWVIPFSFFRIRPLALPEY